MAYTDEIHSVLVEARDRIKELEDENQLLKNMHTKTAEEVSPVADDEISESSSSRSPAFIGYGEEDIEKLASDMDSFIGTVSDQASKEVKLTAEDALDKLFFG